MLTGLTDEQVNERIEQGKVNADENPNTRTYKQIVRENTLTFFNFLHRASCIPVPVRNFFHSFTLYQSTDFGQELEQKKECDTSMYHTLCKYFYNPELITSRNLQLCSLG